MRFYQVVQYKIDVDRSSVRSLACLVWRNVIFWWYVQPYYRSSSEAIDDDESLFGARGDAHGVAGDAGRSDGSMPNSCTSRGVASFGNSGINRLLKSRNMVNAIG